MAGSVARIFVVGLLIGAACSDLSDADGSDDGTTADCGTEPPKVRVVNNTGNAIDELLMVACDMSTDAAYPVPPDALPTGGELTVNLPGPGCWIISYTGEGCFTDQPLMTEVSGCETVTWEVDEQFHGCAGG